MSNCQHAPLSGAALMAICATCGQAYDAAPPVHIRGPRAAGAPRRTGIAARRKRSEVIDTTVSIFQRSSVMTPLAAVRKPRTAPPVADVAAPVAPPRSVPPLPQHAPAVAAPALDPAPTSPRPRRESPESICRAEYDRYILAMFDRAQLECNSFFDSAARIAGAPRYTAWELFTHRKTVIAKWGSEELLSFFSFNRRLSYAQFREQYREGQRSERTTESDVA